MPLVHHLSTPEVTLMIQSKGRDEPVLPTSMMCLDASAPSKSLNHAQDVTDRYNGHGSAFLLRSLLEKPPKSIVNCMFKACFRLRRAAHTDLLLGSIPAVYRYRVAPVKGDYCSSPEGEQQYGLPVVKASGIVFFSLSMVLDPV